MPASDNLIRVARALSSIPEQRFVFAGAGILPLLLSDPAAPPPRFTKDVDTVVNVLTYGQWERLRIRLSDCGLNPRADAPNPRHCLFYLGDLEVDVMPLNVPEILFYSRMLQLGYEYAQPHHVAEDLDILALSGPSFLAAKVEAFTDRGVRDVHMSKDLIDIVTVLDGRLEIGTECAEAAPEIRQFIANRMPNLVGDSTVMDVISDFLRGSGREQRVIELMRALSA